MQTHRADDYFQRRAETELTMAEKATSPAAVQAHYELANLYLAQLDRVSEDDEHLSPSSPPRQLP
jgi:hypothetical protein